MLVSCPLALAVSRGDLEQDRRRASIIRDEIGPDNLLMMDANQVWDVDDAIAWMKELGEYDPHWIEEPTSPDDVLGHATIRKALSPIKVATGEHCQNRIVFKQLMQAGAIDFCQNVVGQVRGRVQPHPLLDGISRLEPRFLIPVC